MNAPLGTNTPAALPVRGGWKRPRTFWLWIAMFYPLWAALVALGGHWQAVASHWPISVVMVLGSYVAGSTPMGGGSVSFPFLVLLFDHPPTLGRSFAFAAQALGMSSAALFIMTHGRPVAWGMLRWVMLGSLAATPIGLAFITPRAPDLLVKTFFAVLWAAFGVVHLLRLRAFVALQGSGVRSPAFDRAAGLLVGLLGGGVASAVTGVGIDMMTYLVLILLARADLRVAIPTAVMAMAFTSIVGIATTAALHAIDPSVYPLSGEVYHNWLAAAPVIVVGAPFGAFVVSRMGRTPALLVVSVLCVAQFGWLLWSQGPALGAVGITAACAGAALLALALLRLERAGRRCASRTRTAQE